ncbi:MAG: nucleotidyl transferase AbiEii/AbiGii toxin family protein [Deltaproteobacteria bacterium]|nr:nucleotidyl transferase AbiEii/AbiGii toxin family protein [Deltaproteobacteria bacterium]
MTRAEHAAAWPHEDEALFLEAVRYTAAETGFAGRLVEKDYFASLVLAHLAQQNDHPLVFKGGTCLAKVHADFFRLSEDLDFAIGMDASSTRKQRQDRAKGFKGLLEWLVKRTPSLSTVEPLRGANESRQYLGVIGFESRLTRESQSIKFEVSLREPLLTHTVTGDARTILLDPVSERPRLQPIQLACMSLSEAISEKCRAALTRRDVAIRDFFDIDYIIRTRGFDLEDVAFVTLLRSKLAVDGNPPADLGDERLRSLREQVQANLRPVLRPADFDAFDLDRAIERVTAVASALE